MKTADGIPCVEPIPEERRLVRRARAGDASAFMDLYDAYGDDLFRYVYFRVLSDVAAEGIMSQVVRHAWDHLGAFHWRKDASFVRWVYEIARTQVLIYYKANLKTTTFNIPSLLDAADYRLNVESQDPNPLDAWSHHLRLLTGDIEQSRLQTTASLIMRKYLEYLHPGRVTRPSPTFNAYTRTWLARYLELHPHPSAQTRLRERLRLARESLSNVSAWRLPLAGQRLAVVYAVLVLALLVTGTAKAQSALPGDLLYGLKRTSEQAWLTVSPDPLGTEITLADRRLEEMLAVENDPLRSAGARDAYLQALIQLNTNGDVAASVRIQPILADHRKKLQQSGLSSNELQAFLVPVIGSETGTANAEVDAPVISAVATPVETEAASVSVSSDTQAAPTVESAAVAVVPTDTPQATETPIEVVPTDVAPTDVVPTDVAPTDVVPTDVAPTEVAPTDVTTPTLDPSLIDTTPTPSQ